MAILLTNGKYFIAHNKTGGVIKVIDKSQAQDFITIDNAIEQAYKTPGKCTGYYYMIWVSKHPFYSNSLTNVP